MISRLRRINLLIEKLNGNKEKSDNYSFKAMIEHVGEIKELYLKKDEHWAAETIDLLIHCLLLLDRNRYQRQRICELLNLRCRKFEEKISNQLRK